MQFLADNSAANGGEIVFATSVGDVWQHPDNKISNLLTADFLGHCCFIFSNVLFNLTMKTNIHTLSAHIWNML